MVVAHYHTVHFIRISIYTIPNSHNFRTIIILQDDGFRLLNRISFFNFDLIRKLDKFQFWKQHGDGDTNGLYSFCWLFFDFTECDCTNINSWPTNPHVVCLLQTVWKVALCSCTIGNRKKGQETRQKAVVFVLVMFLVCNYSLVVSSVKQVSCKEWRTSFWNIWMVNSFVDQQTHRGWINWLVWSLVETLYYFHFQASKLGFKNPRVKSFYQTYWLSLDIHSSLV